MVSVFKIRSQRPQQSWPRLNNTLDFPSHSDRLGWQRARDRKLPCPPILAPPAASVEIFFAATELTVPYSFVHDIFSGSALIYNRRAHHIVRLPAANFPRISPTLNARVSWRLFGSRPWIDALFLLVMAIAWLGEWDWII